MKADEVISDSEIAELAAKVANDITEDIDCRETRRQLRECIRWWSAASCRESAARANFECQVVLLRSALDYLVRAHRATMQQFTPRELDELEGAMLSAELVLKSTEPTP